MGSFYLVRHGQARLGTDDYDRLSALGQRQCHALGEHLRASGLRFQAVLRGRLKRHKQSLQALTEGYGDALPAETVCAALDEYDATAVVQAARAGLPREAPEQKPPSDPAAWMRQHARLLRAGLLAWMRDEHTPQGLPPYAHWAQAIADLLDEVRQQHTAGDVLIVSSGGPIATAVGRLLQTPPEGTVELNLRIRNSALTELAASPRRLALLSFNHLPHLAQPERRDWITYA